jgi:hypothetical protein
MLSPCGLGAPLPPLPVAWVWLNGRCVRLLRAIGLLVIGGWTTGLAARITLGLVIAARARAGAELPRAARPAAKCGTSA